MCLSSLFLVRPGSLCDVAMAVLLERIPLFLDPSTSPCMTSLVDVCVCLLTCPNHLILVHFTVNTIWKNRFILCHVDSERICHIILVKLIAVIVPNKVFLSTLFLFRCSPASFSCYHSRRGRHRSLPHSQPYTQLPDCHKGSQHNNVVPFVRCP